MDKTEKEKLQKLVIEALREEKQVQDEEKARMAAVVGIVYESKSGYWRGFCTPYNLTCNAASKGEAMKKLERLVSIHDEVLTEWKVPRRLVYQELTDAEDKMAFEEAWPAIPKEELQVSETTNGE